MRVSHFFQKEFEDQSVFASMTKLTNVHIILAKPVEKVFQINLIL